MSNCMEFTFDQKHNCSYLAFTDDAQMNQQNNEWYWCSMKMSASKIWNLLILILGGSPCPDGVCIVGKWCSTP